MCSPFGAKHRRYQAAGKTFFEFPFFYKAKLCKECGHCGMKRLLREGLCKNAGRQHVFAAGRRGSSGMCSPNDAEWSAGAKQMMSFRIHQFDMNLTVKSVSSRCRRRQRDGVQDRIIHGSPQHLDTEASMGCHFARAAIV